VHPTESGRLSCTQDRHRDGESEEWWEGGSRSTGQTVSECGRGSVTYCFTGKLPDLLGVKARSFLVYTQPWISAWNMSTSSQPISHRGGAVWAADTSRFPWTMRPIPHKCPLSVIGGVHRQNKAMALYCSTGPQNCLLPRDTHAGIMRYSQQLCYKTVIVFCGISNIINCFLLCSFSIPILHFCLYVSFQSNIG